jgi:hypothetical protein
MDRELNCVYLTLPTKRATMDSMIGNLLHPAGISGNSLLVEQESLTLTSSHKRRFTVCLRYLGLEVFTHDSQLRASVSALSPSPTADPKINEKIPDVEDAKG